MTPRELAKELLLAEAKFDERRKPQDTDLVQILIGNEWFQIDTVGSQSFVDTDGTSNVVVLKAVPA